MLFQHILLGALFIGIGVVTLKYNFQLVGYTGHIGFVEKYLGYGSTYVFLKLVSVFLCIGGFLYITGLFEPIMTWMLSPLAQFFPHTSGL